MKKIAASLLAISLLLAACGCAEQSELPRESVADTSLIQSVETSGVNTETSDVITQGTTEETTVVTEFKTIPPPEDGWTLELLNEVTYINGKEVDIPFDYSELGEDFSIPELIVSEEAKRIGGKVYYKNKSAFSIAGDYSNLIPSLSDCTIDTFLLIEDFNESEMTSSEIIAINGITVGSSFSDVKAQMGTYDTENFRELETGFSYDIIGTDGYINFTGDDRNNIISSITINYVR